MGGVDLSFSHYRALLVSITLRYISKEKKKKCYLVFLLCKFEEGHRGPGNLCRACVFDTYFETCVLITNLGGKNTFQNCGQVRSSSGAKELWEVMSKGVKH